MIVDDAAPLAEAARLYVRDLLDVEHRERVAALARSEQLARHDALLERCTCGHLRHPLGVHRCARRTDALHSPYVTDPPPREDRHP